MKAKKGIFFTLDSVFGLMILITIYGVFTLLTIETVSSEVMYESLHTYAEDTIDVMSKLTLWDIRYDPIVLELTNTSALDLNDMNKTALDAVGALWATNDTGNATKLISVLFKNTMPPNVEWAVQINRGGGFETAYNTTELDEKRRMSSVSRRLVSGYMKGKPNYGFTTRAFLTNILGRGDRQYVFFGGFVGQGNLTVYIRDIPSDAQIEELYLELALGNTSELYVNGTHCRQLIKPPGSYAVDNWTITDASCLNKIKPGELTRIEINFTKNLTSSYIGGGFIRVSYASPTRGPLPTGVTRYYFPGIDGLINLYDSFYIPGNVTEITGKLNITSNYTIFMNLGGHTPIEINGSEQNRLIELVDDNFSYLKESGYYKNFSLTTVPLRLGTPNASLAVDSSEGDIVLVNDLSGSMELCEDQVQSCCDPPACPQGIVCACSPGETCSQMETTFIYPPDGKQYCGPRFASTCNTPPNQKKVDILKNASNEFLKIVLSNPNNMVGVVEYSGPGDAKSNVPDLVAQAISINLTSVASGRLLTYNITGFIYNNGSDISLPFRVDFYNGSVDVNNVSGRLIESIEVPSLGGGQWANVSINWTARLFSDTRIIVYADPQNVIAETNESNNDKNMTITVGMPNAIVVPGSFSLKRVSRDNRVYDYTYSLPEQYPICRNFTNVTLTFRIQETQGFDIGQAEVKLTFNFTNKTGDVRAIPANYINTTLAANELKTVTFTIDPNTLDQIGAELGWPGDSFPSMAGRSAFNVTIDPLNFVQETNETDNTQATTEFFDLPDLRATWLGFNPTRICGAMPTDITIYVDFMTRTCPVLGTFNVSVYRDSVAPGNQVGTKRTNVANMIDSFRTIEISMLYTGTFAADTTFIGWVDYPPVPNGTIMEQDETNNNAQATLQVTTLPDLTSRIRLVAGSFGPFNSVCFNENVPLTVEAATVNNGCPVNTPFNTSVYSRPESGGPNTLMGSAVIPSIGAGSEVYSNIPITVNIPNNTILMSWADSPPEPNGYIVETNEANNQDELLLQERATNLAVIEMNTVPTDPFMRYLTPPAEEIDVCRELTTNNFQLNMKVTNNGVCNITNDFNVSFNYKRAPGASPVVLSNQVVSGGLARGGVKSFSAIWSGKDLWTGQFPWLVVPNPPNLLNITELYLEGVADAPYGTHPRGDIYETSETDNINRSIIHYRTADVANTNMTIEKKAPGLYEVNATIKNVNALCRTPRNFDVTFFGPNLFAAASEFNRITIASLNPLEQRTVSVDWTFNPPNGLPIGDNWVYAWANWNKAGYPWYIEREFPTVCAFSDPPVCNNINKTVRTVPPGGGGAPYITHLVTALFAPKPMPPAKFELSSFSVSPSKATCGLPTKFKLTAVISNIGGETKGGEVEFYSELGKISLQQFPPITKGESRKIEYYWEGAISKDTVFTAKAGDSTLTFIVLDPPGLCPASSPWIKLNTNSIVRTHPFSSSLNSLSDFVNKSETWYGTCISCGIINATDMMRTARDGSMHAIVLMSDGEANLNRTGGSDNAKLDAINAACEAPDDIKIYTVGFGSTADSVTLQAIAACGGGQYFQANNLAELTEAYKQIASMLLNLSYSEQVLDATGASRMTIYPDSYLEFNYAPKLPPVNYRDLIINIETDNFSRCDGNFDVPNGLIPFDVKVVSYSGSNWTSKVTFNDGTNTYVVFNLTNFGGNYQKLGDPFVVEFDPTTPVGAPPEYPGIIRTGPINYNWVNVSNGAKPNNYSSDCSDRNRVIYKALLKGSVPFTQVLPGMLGRNVSVYYDLKHAEDLYYPDAYIYVPIGIDLPGVPFNATPINMSELGKENETNALAASFISLMDRLNFWQFPHYREWDAANNKWVYQHPPCTHFANTALNGPDPVVDQCCLIESVIPTFSCCYDQPSGSKCNRIDTRISADIIMKTVSINEIPYMYGPVDIGVVTWIK